MKIFVVGGAINYTNFIKRAIIVDKLEDADVVLFTGGEDVDPSLYGHRNIYSRSNIKRDYSESTIFKRVNPITQVCVGICRGSQFLCVMNGGILVQDCTDHANGETHGIVSSDGKYLYDITSTHHQMQYPYNLKNQDYEILFISYSNLSKHYYGDNIDIEEILRKGEPEIVSYHKKELPRCLAIQGHPEMIPNSPVADMINNLIEKLVNEIR